MKAYKRADLSNKRTTTTRQLPNSRIKHNTADNHADLRQDAHWQDNHRGAGAERHNREREGQNQREGRNPDRSTTSHLRRQATGGWQDSGRLQHPGMFKQYSDRCNHHSFPIFSFAEGIDAASCASTAWRNERRRMTRTTHTRKKKEDTDHTQGKKEEIVLHGFRLTPSHIGHHFPHIHMYVYSIPHCVVN